MKSNGLLSRVNGVFVALIINALSACGVSPGSDTRDYTKKPVLRPDEKPKTEEVPPMIAVLRKDLLKMKKARLEAEIPKMNKLKQDTFNLALDHYEKYLEKANNNTRSEIIKIVRDDSKNNEAVADIIVKKLYTVNVDFTSDWMHLQDTEKAQEWQNKGVVISYMDYANASLGGGAFHKDGWVQEEQMVGFCTEFALLLAGVPYRDDGDLQKKTNVNYITRSTRKADSLSPRPKYLTNIRCTTGTPRGTTRWDKLTQLEHRENPPAINIIAVASVNLRGRPKGDYELLDLIDLFSNVYRAFELVKNTNAGKENVIFGGRLGAGAFEQSVLMTAAMQILAAKIVGIENLILTAQRGGKNFPQVKNIYAEAVTKVEAFLGVHNIIGMKIEDVLRDFLKHVKGDSKWQKNSDYS